MRWLLVLALGVGGCVGPPVESEPEPDPVVDSRPESEPDTATEQEPAEPVTVEGSDGSTKPFVLPPGRATVEIVTEGDCHFGLTLKTPDGGRAEERLPAVDGNSTSSGELYGLNGGDYYIEAFTGPPESCTWSATFTPGTG